MAERVDLDELIAGLYASEPEEFIAQRKEAVRALKAAGQRDEAESVRRLAKPSASAWAVNVLAHRDPAAIDDVVEHGDELRRAQTGGTNAADVREAQGARRQAIRQAADRAVELAGRPLSGAHRTEVAETLEAASADSDAAAEVRAGRLVKPLAVPSGFEQLGGLTLVPGGRAERAPAKREQRPKKDEASEPDRTRAEEEAARARHTMLQTEADTAAEAAAAARAESAAVRQRIDELEAEVARLEREQRDAQAQLKTATREARDAEKAEQQAERRAERAAARADEARPAR